MPTLVHWNKCYIYYYTKKKLSGKLIWKTCICGTVLANKPRADIVNIKEIRIGAASCKAVIKISLLTMIIVSIMDLSNPKPPAGIILKVSTKALCKTYEDLKAEISVEILYDERLQKNFERSTCIRNHKRSSTKTHLVTNKTCGHNDPIKSHFRTIS